MIYVMARLSSGASRSLLSDNSGLVSRNLPKLAAEAGPPSSVIAVQNFVKTSNAGSIASYGKPSQIVTEEACVKMERIREI
jgi:hypothetical protein